MEFYCFILLFSLFSFINYVSNIGIFPESGLILIRKLFSGQELSEKKIMIASLYRAIACGFILHILSVPVKQSF